MAAGGAARRKPLVAYFSCKIPVVLLQLLRELPKAAMLWRFTVFVAAQRCFGYALHKRRFKLQAAPVSDRFGPLLVCFWALLWLLLELLRELPKATIACSAQCCLSGPLCSLLLLSVLRILRLGGFSCGLAWVGMGVFGGMLLNMPTFSRTQRMVGLRDV